MKLQTIIRFLKLGKNKDNHPEKTYNNDENSYLTHLWNTNSENEWDMALKQYWNLIKPQNTNLEFRMERLNPDGIKNLSPEEFYNFLYDEYFVWKYTAKNRLATTRTQLNRYKTENRLNDLDRIRMEILGFDLNDIELGLRITKQINGLGIAGASGLLSLLYPKYFGTVDQFVVLNLRRIESLKQKESLLQMNPESLRLKDGVELINILRERANELNKVNNTDKWTPRNIDKVLWAYRK